MNDVILTGELTNLSSLIRGMETPFVDDDAFMILERVPERWLTEDEFENSICFETYKKDKTDYNSWQRGRIFDSKKEVRWAWNGERFHVIYTGASFSFDSLLPMNTENWNDSNTVRYYLWGTGFNPIQSKNTNPLFMEIQIPKILCYPIICKEKERPKITAIEYRDKMGHTVHYRFSTEGVKNESL